MATLQELDAACIAHLQHPAMPTADPLTDSLYAQLEAPASEGAQPHTAYADGTPDSSAGNGPGWWLSATALLAALAGACFFPWGA